LEAFTELFRNLPPDAGMAFVLVQHLDPQHESVITQLLKRAASMPVHEVTNNLRVEANNIYVIPPNANLGISEGILTLKPRVRSRGGHHSIDAFFESLAQDQRERAIGVILSGTATDGTQGLEAIKIQGGITFAQNESAKYDSMPRSAVAAGCVDCVLKPEDIAKELILIAKHPYVENGLGQSEREAPEVKNGFKKILRLLRNRNSVDFSLYKSATFHRRIARRMVLNKCDTVEGYARFLRGNDKELDALRSDCLIRATSFFRDSETFDLLQRKVFPRLLKLRTDEPLRVWVPGCSTGQEAYSIAMALQESLEKLPWARKLQVFATDLNEVLLGKARHGLYGKNLVQDVSAERLRRFFVEEEGGYRVIKSLRERVVFARQNLINDPPFSRMDLISCPNLLVELDPNLKEKALPTFHYALKPEGFLLLGASDSISGFTGLFQPVDGKHKIYSSKTAATLPLRLPVSIKPDNEKRALLPSGARRSGPGQIPVPPEPRGGLRDEIIAAREADRLMVNQFAPPGVLVNAELQVLRFRGPTAAWLEPPTGKASFDLLKMAREGLMLPLRAAINKAKKQNKTVRRENIPMRQNGKSLATNLEVIPLKHLREVCFLILFEEAREFLSNKQRERRGGRLLSPALPSSSSSLRRNAELERELAETRDYLQSIQEQYEASKDELQAANEEVQSANEELQSINEELETAKEELEASNEGLTTVNEEMADRNAELSRLGSDLLNLQTSTSLGIVLLARDLTIRRFSVQAEKQFNLIASDVGRPIRNVRHNFVFPDNCSSRGGEAHSSPGSQRHLTPAVASDPSSDLEAWLYKVVAEVHTRECDVQDKEGRWYSLRARPYLAIDNKVDGAVLVVVDITDLKRTEQEIKAARDHAEAIIRTVRDPLVILRTDLKVDKANEAFYRAFKITPQETENVLIYELGRGQWDIPKLRHLLDEIIPRNSSFSDFEVTHDFDHIGRRTMLLNARRLDNASGDPERILLGIEDITERLQIEDDLRESKALIALKQAELQIQQQRDELTRVSRLAMLGEFSALLAHELSQPLSAILCDIGSMRHHLSCHTLDLEGVQKILADIVASDNRANEIIRGLRLLYRRGSVHMRPLDLNAVVRDLLKLLRHDMAKWNVDLSTELAGELPTIEGDSVQLQEVILNLVTNAGDAMADAEPKSRQLIVRTSASPEGVHLTVTDRGRGIPPESLTCIFDSFYTTRPDGMGLGLSVCRLIIDAHHGILWAENNPDGGASFHFVLPAMEVSDE
jgi:two-component system CheB/CheR fusion protein